MTFKFKLFRGLTAFNIIFSTFMLMGGVVSVLAMGNPQLLLGLLLLGAVLIHAILSLHLQKSLLDSNMVLKESTPGGIRIIGGICILFGLLMGMNGLTVFMLALSNNPGQLEEIAKQLPAEQQTAFMTVLKPLAGALVIISVLILTNVLLSFSFLKEWKQKQEEELF